MEKQKKKVKLHKTVFVSFKSKDTWSPHMGDVCLPGFLPEKSLHVVNVWKMLHLNPSRDLSPNLTK